METYKIIDMETWPRRTHWNYYRNLVKAQTSMTKKIDVTNFVSWCHEKKQKVSPLLLYVISKTVNSLECMRMFALEDGNPAIWDAVHPNYTIFHEDDKTFSDVWIEYTDDQDTFLQNFEQIMMVYKDKKGIKVREDQPANFFCISGIPWISYDSFTTSTAGDRPPMLFPVLNYGKYEEENGKLMMPVSITISHAAMDGYHEALFFQTLQENLDNCEVSHV